MADIFGFPRQMLSNSAKTQAWRRKVVDWADSRSCFNYSPVRESLIHKKINYDLVNGVIHMEDMETILNPNRVSMMFDDKKIQHYPILNGKLNVLQGEESARPFQYRVVVTNPTAISDIEAAKREAIMMQLEQLIESSVAKQQEAQMRLQAQQVQQEEMQKAEQEAQGQPQTPQEEQQMQMMQNQQMAQQQNTIEQQQQSSPQDMRFEEELERLSSYFQFEWQDIRELRANAIINHYSKEQNFPMLFNSGFMDAMVVGEEIYQCDIVGGEPVMTKVNPLSIEIYMAGNSNKVEDADLIIFEEYWSPGRIIDTFYEQLSKKDIEYITEFFDKGGQSYTDAMGNIDERYGLVNTVLAGVNEDERWRGLFLSPVAQNDLPFDLAGNIRVLRIFWKSLKKIKKIKHYDPETGEELFDFYPDSYICRTEMGEEETAFWVNEAWEGTKIGEEVYVNIRPRLIQYNTLNNPSRCHFGIVGSIYNINEFKPYSLVDMMKPYCYYYDMIHDRLIKLMQRNWGNLVRFDFSKKPKNWDVDKWMYYARVFGLAVEDSFNEGNVGAATGKLAGGLNNNSTGVISAGDGNTIQQYIQWLQWIEQTMSSVVGITAQRQGQISNRETVGGVERSVLQSSHITERLFFIHDDVKKRALECFLETAKIAMRGKNKKFKYIVPGITETLVDFDGDEFAECDYGLVIDNSQDTQKFESQIETLAQAALQTQTLSFSSILKLYSSCSISEKQKIIEIDEKKRQQQAQEAQQQQMQQQQQLAQMQQQLEQIKLQMEEQKNIRDNETKIQVAQIEAQAMVQGKVITAEGSNNTEAEEADRQEAIRQFNAELEEKKKAREEEIKIKMERLQFDKNKQKENAAIERQRIKNK